MSSLDSPSLIVRDLSVAYGQTIVLRNVDLCVGRGEMVSLVGPSGSGKSSLLLALCGLLEPVTGSVEVEGHELTSAGPRQRDEIRSRLFGFVFQSSDLVPELTMAENVSLPLRLAGVRPRQALRRAIDQLESVGVGDLAKRLSTEVSVGQLQRVAIARALVHRPPIILADEPTGALDNENAVMVFDLLRTSASEAPSSVVVVTHDIELAKQADRLLRISRSTVRGEGLS